MTTCSIIDTKKDWDLAHISHWQHTWEYKTLHENLGRTANCVLIKKEGQVIGYFTIVTFSLFKNKTICYTPYGPVFLQKFSQETLDAVRVFLKDYGQKYNALCVRTEIDKKYYGFYKTPLFAYRTSFHQARGEAMMDLCGKSIDSLYTQFSKSTKRNIKKAQKNKLNCVVYSGKEIMSQLEKYIALNEKNTADHKTTTHTREYFSHLFTLISNNKDNFVVTVEKDNIPLAISTYTVFNNKAYCPFGASTQEGKRLGAYYLNKLKAIEHMLDLDISEFNWGGIAIGKNDNNLSGLNSFKLGWRTETKKHNDFYDLILSYFYWLYLAYNIIKKIR